MTLERIILGVRVQSLSMEEAVAQGLRLLRTPGTHWGFTPNPKLLTMAYGDGELTEILNGAELSLPDGVGVVLASRWTGAPLAGRVAGADYALALARAAGEQGRRIFLLGGAPGVASRAGAELLRRCPGLVLAGTADGYFADPLTAAQAIQRTGAELVYVCLGCPKQEKWIARYGALTGARLLLGLGGTLDVLSGEVHRAPERVQRLGLEWLWRAVRQPRRIRELWRLPVFLAQTIYWQGRNGSRTWREN